MCTVHELWHTVSESDFVLPYYTSPRSVACYKMWPWRKQSTLVHRNRAAGACNEKQNELESSAKDQESLWLLLSVASRKSISMLCKALQDDLGCSICYGPNLQVWRLSSGKKIKNLLRNLILSSNSSLFLPLLLTKNSHLYIPREN